MCSHSLRTAVVGVAGRTRFSPTQHTLRSLYYKAASTSSVANSSSDVEQWRTELKRVDGALKQALYLVNNEKNGKVTIDPSAFTSRALKSKVQSAVRDYRTLVSQLARTHHEEDRERRITGALLAKRPFDSKILSFLDSTQREFLESHSLRFYALLKVQASPEGLKKGFDERAFTTRPEQEKQWTDQALKKTRYGRSTKSSKIKTELPLKARMTADTRAHLAQATNVFNLKLMAQVWPDLHPRNLRRKSPKCYGVVQVGWEKEKGSKTIFQRVEVAQFIDRVRAVLVETAVHPIAEYQADPHSFAWRRDSGRSAGQASHLVKSILHKDYQKRPGMIRVDIPDGFDRIRHEAILDSYPLSLRYQPFLVNFLKARRRGHKTPPPQVTENKWRARRLGRPTPQAPEWEWRPKCGVLFDSGLGQALVNNALDGLEDALLKDLPLNNAEGLRVIRYGTSILIVGTARYAILEQVRQRLLLFLQERGLGSSETQNNSRPIFTFNPGTSVEYLGFNYLFTGGNKTEGKFSRGHWTRDGFVKPPKFQVIIAQSSVNRCSQLVKSLLSRRHTPASVENLITRYNRLLEQIAAYFNVSSSAHKQIYSLMYNKGFPAMRRLLRRKFRSTPKLGTMIRSKFQSKDGRFRSEGLAMVKGRDFDTDFGSLSAATPTTSFLTSNVYLDPDCEREAREKLRSAPPTPVWIDDAFAPKFKLTKDFVYADEDEKDEDQSDLDDG